MSNELIINSNSIDNLHNYLETIDSDGHPNGYGIYYSYFPNNNECR